MFEPGAGLPEIEWALKGVPGEVGQKELEVISSEEWARKARTGADYPGVSRSSVLELESRRLTNH